MFNLTYYGPKTLFNKVDNKSMNASQIQDSQWCKLFIFSTRKVFEVVIWFNLYKKQKRKNLTVLYTGTYKHLLGKKI